MDKGTRHGRVHLIQGIIYSTELLSIWGGGACWRLEKVGIANSRKTD